MYYHSRTLCEVLREIRECVKTLNFSYLLGHIEEIQVLANRMESHLDMERSYSDMRDKLRKLKKEIKELKAERDELKPKKDDE